MTDKKPYRPSVFAASACVIAGATALGLAAYMRYGLVEPSSVGLVCDAGAMTSTCVIRRVFIGIFVWNGFGLAAVVATVLAIVRPSALLVGFALVFGGLGVILYNTGLSALALALVPFVFARPQPVRDFLPE